MASTRNRYCNEHNVFGFKITMKIETSTQHGIYDCIPYDIHDYYKTFSLQFQ